MTPLGNSGERSPTLTLIRPNWLRSAETQVISRIVAPRANNTMASAWTPDSMISGTDSSSPIEATSPKKPKGGVSTYGLAGTINSDSTMIPTGSVSKDAVAAVEHKMCSHYSPSIASTQDAVDICEADERKLSFYRPSSSKGMPSDWPIP